MKHTLHLFCVLALCSLHAEDITLTTGKVLIKVEFITDEADRVKLSHDGGVGWFAKTDVPRDFLAKNGVSVPAAVMTEAAAAVQQAQQLAALRAAFPTFRDRNGKTHDSAHVTAIEPTGIKLVKDGAVLRLPFDRLPPAVATQLGLNADEVAKAAEAQQQQMADAKGYQNRRLTAQSILERQKHYIELRIAQWEDGAIIGQAKIVKKKEADVAVNPRFSRLTGETKMDTQRVEYIEEERDIGRLKVFGLPQSLIGQKTWSGVLWIGGEREVKTAQGESVMIRDAFTALQSGIDYLAKNGLGDYTEDLTASRAVGVGDAPPGSLAPPDDPPYRCSHARAAHVRNPLSRPSPLRAAHPRPLHRPQSQWTHRQSKRRRTTEVMENHSRLKVESRSIGQAPH